jgi:carboxypeptidase T
MRRFFLILTILFPAFLFGREMLVRAYVDSYEDLSFPHLKAIDYAGGRPGEYYDIILTEKEYYSDLLPTGIPSEIIYYDLESVMEKIRGQYYSYTEIRNLLQTMASNYPSICKFDSIGKTYQGRWIYCVKISDNPGFEDPDEPDCLIIGCHHAREWASVVVPYFIADSLTRAYASVSWIKTVVDSREIWIIPCMNVDGFEYDYPGGNWWRKNRQPFGGATGTDPNRTYNGCCNRDKYGEWGAIPDDGSVTHYQGNDVFCGPYGEDSNGNSAPCNDALVRLIRVHEFNYIDSYHSYGELVLWSWGYTGSQPPNNSYLVSYGTSKASLIQRLWGGTYSPYQGYNLYPTSGGSDDWMYGWYHYVNGTNCVSFTTELGEDFYQPSGDLDHICRENFEGAFYMFQEAANIRNDLSAEVPPPTVNLDDTSTTGDYTVYWSPRNDQINNPTHWELCELTGLSSTVDDLESGSGFWDLSGFSLSTTRYHSSNHSFYSGSSSNMVSTATTKYPYPVKSGDQLTFWCWYDLEPDFDVATVEVSVNGLEWFQLDDRYTGNQTSWQQKTYSLASWVGTSVFIRFRAMTDDYQLDEGIYIDDISPVPDFSSDVVVSSSITDTFYAFTNKPDDEYWYRVRGNNAAYGWGNYSPLSGIGVGVGVALPKEKDELNRMSLSVSPNPFSSTTTITFHGAQAHTSTSTQAIEIYDIGGRMVRKISLLPFSFSLGAKATWDGRDNDGKRLPSGMYFLTVRGGETSLNQKLILLD